MIMFFLRKLSEPNITPPARIRTNRSASVNFETSIPTSKQSNYNSQNAPESAIKTAAGSVNSNYTRHAVRKVSLQTPIDPATLEKYRRSLNQYKKRNENAFKSLSMNANVTNGYHVNNNSKIEFISCFLCRAPIVTNHNYNVNLNRTCMLCNQTVCNNCSIVSVINNAQRAANDVDHGFTSKSGLRFGLLCKPCSKRQDRGDATNSTTRNNAHNISSNHHHNGNDRTIKKDVKVETSSNHHHQQQPISSSTVSLNLDSSDFVEDSDVIEINLSGSNKKGFINNQNAISERVNSNKNKNIINNNSCSNITSDEEDANDDDDDESEGPTDDADNSKSNFITIVHDKLPVSNKMSNLKNSSSKRNTAYHYQSLDEVTMANTRVNGIRILKTRFQDEVNDECEISSISKEPKSNHAVKIMEFSTLENSAKSSGLVSDL
jgi:hypothetical protein